MDAGSAKAAAHELGITEGTVKTHLRAMYDRLGVDTAAQAAFWLGVETAEGVHPRS